MRKFIETKVLTHPDFWFCYLISSFGQIGEPFEADLVSGIFNVNEKTSLDLWNSLTGYSENLEESEEDIENPNSIKIEFQNQITLIIEFHPGNTYYFLENSLSKESAQIGDISGHWLLPMLRWNEIVSLSENVKSDAGSENYASFVILLMIPCVWLTRDEDFEEVRKILIEKWIHTGLVSQENAELLALKFNKAVNAKDKFHWFTNSEGNWVTDAHWSFRYFDKSAQQIALIDSLINLARNNQSN